MNIKTTIALLATVSLAACVIEPPAGDVELAQLVVSATPVVSAKPVVTDTVATPTPAGEVTPTVAATVTPVVSATPVPSVPVYEGEVYGAYMLGNGGTSNQLVFAESQSRMFTDIALPANVDLTSGDISSLTGTFTFVDKISKVLYTLDEQKQLVSRGVLSDFDSESNVSVYWAPSDIGVIYPSVVDGVKEISLYQFGSSLSSVLTTGNQDSYSVKNFFIADDHNSFVIETSVGSFYGVENILASEAPKLYYSQDEFKETGAVSEVEQCGDVWLALQDIVVDAGPKDTPDDDSIQKRLFRLNSTESAPDYYVDLPLALAVDGRDVSSFVCDNQKVRYVANYNFDGQITGKEVQFRENSLNGNSATAEPIKLDNVGNYERISQFDFNALLTFDTSASAASVFDLSNTSYQKVSLDGSGVTLPYLAQGISGLQSWLLVSDLTNLVSAYNKSESGLYELIGSVEMAGIDLSDGVVSPIGNVAMIVNAGSASATLVVLLADEMKTLAIPELQGATWLSDGLLVASTAASLKIVSVNDLTVIDELMKSSGPVKWSLGSALVFQ